MSSNIIQISILHITVQQYATFKLSRQCSVTKTAFPKVWMSNRKDIAVFDPKKKQCFWTLPILSVPQRSSGSEGPEGWFPTWHWGEWLEGCWIHYHAPQYRHYIIEIILRDTKGIKGSKTSYNESSTECFVDPDWLHVTSMYIYIYINIYIYILMATNITTNMFQSSRGFPSCCLYL